MLKKIALILLLCSGCKTSPEKMPPYAVQEFNGRDEVIAYGQTLRRPVYQAKVPLSWVRVDPDESAPLTDTTKPIVAFILEEGLVLKVHTFPSEEPEARIPPEMQVERWQKQCSTTAEALIKRAGHGGFAGLYFECNEGDETVCGWSLQLDFDHYQTLRFLASTLEEEEHYKQMSADYTIKTSGPSHLINKHRKELDLFAESFELIQEIPCR